MRLRNVVLLTVLVLAAVVIAGCTPGVEGETPAAGATSTAAPPTETADTPVPPSATPEPAGATPSPTAPAEEPDALAGSEWLLVSFGPVGAEEPVVAGSEITLSFVTGGQAGGSGGCNSYGGSYQVDGSKVTFGEIVSTLMACADEAVNEQEGRYLAPLVGQYDFVIIDCPPSLGLLTVNALMAATEVLIPVDPGLFPLIGLNLLQKTIAMVRQANPGLEIAGVVPTLLDRTALARDTQLELQQAFGARLLPPIPRRVAIGEAHAAGKDIFAYDGSSDGAEAYAALLEEILDRG